MRVAHGCDLGAVTGRVDAHELLGDLGAVCRGVDVAAAGDEHRVDVVDHLEQSFVRRVGTRRDEERVPAGLPHSVHVAAVHREPVIRFAADQHRDGRAQRCRHQRLTR
jgi:hypothetical protein